MLRRWLSRAATGCRQPSSQLPPEFPRLQDSTPSPLRPPCLRNSTPSPPELPRLRNSAPLSLPPVCVIRPHFRDGFRFGGERQQLRASHTPRGARGQHAYPYACRRSPRNCAPLRSHLYVCGGVHSPGGVCRRRLACSGVVSEAAIAEAPSGETVRASLRTASPTLSRALPPACCVAHTIPPRNRRGHTPKEVFGKPTAPPRTFRRLSPRRFASRAPLFVRPAALFFVRLVPSARRSALRTPPPRPALLCAPTAPRPARSDGCRVIRLRRFCEPPLPSRLITAARCNGRRLWQSKPAINVFRYRKSHITVIGYSVFCHKRRSLHGR